MKKLIGIILSLVILFSTISSVHLNSRAENNKYGSSSSKFDFQDEWKNKKTYPVLPQDEDWSALSYIELLEACNMPDELVDQCSTDKLADLVLDYPFLIDTLCFETAQQGIDYLKTHSNICEEYFSRDDSINILLQKYEDLEVNYEMLKDKSVKDCFLQVLFHKSCKIFFQSIASPFSAILQPLFLYQFQQRNRWIADTY